MQDLAIEKREVPLISVVTVTLNDSEGLRKTIKSVKRLTEIDRIEHIIVDGGSNYEVSELIDTLGSNALLYSGPDKGLFDAMNKGIRQATGTYVIFMNSGDCFADNHIVRHVYESMRTEIPDIIYGDSLELLESGTVVYKRGRSMRWIAIGMNTHHQSILYRLEVIRQHHIHYNLEYRLAGDYEFTLLCYRASRCTARLQTPISIFQSGGMSQTRYFEAHQEQAQIRGEVFRSRLFANLVLYTQVLNGLLRRRLPGLYWWLKR